MSSQKACQITQPRRIWLVSHKLRRLTSGGGPKLISVNACAQLAKAHAVRWMRTKLLPVRILLTSALRVLAIKSQSCQQEESDRLDARQEWSASRLYGEPRRCHVDQPWDNRRRAIK